MGLLLFFSFSPHTLAHTKATRLTRLFLFVPFLVLLSIVSCVSVRLSLFPHFLLHPKTLFPSPIGHVVNDVWLGLRLVLQHHITQTPCACISATTHLPHRNDVVLSQLMDADDASMSHWMASFACAKSSSPPAKIVVSSAHIATTVRVVSCCTWMWSMCMPLMVCLSMRDNGSMASAKRRGASGHPCPTGPDNNTCFMT